MSKVPVQKVSDCAKAEIDQRAEEVRQRAFDLFQARGAEEGRQMEDWLAAEREVFAWPKAELCEKDDAYEIQVALPGFKANEVEVTATPEEIVMRAASEHEHAHVVWSEFEAKEVYRRFVLPQPAVVDKVTARLEHGILHIDAPRLPPAQASSAAAG